MQVGAGFSLVTSIVADPLLVGESLVKLCKTWNTELVTADNSHIHRKYWPTLHLT